MLGASGSVPHDRLRAVIFNLPLVGFGHEGNPSSAFRALGLSDHDRWLRWMRVRPGRMTGAFVRGTRRRSGGGFPARRFAAHDTTHFFDTNRSFPSIWTRTPEERTARRGTWTGR